MSYSKVGQGDLILLYNQGCSLVGLRVRLQVSVCSSHNLCLLA